MKRILRKRRGTGDGAAQFQERCQSKLLIKRFTAIWALAVISACGGGGGGDEPSPAGSSATGGNGVSTPANNVPLADAGADQAVLETGLVILSGSGSDPDGEPLTYSWTQTSGPPVALSGADSATASFAGPQSDADTEYLFVLTVTDSQGGSSTDSVQVMILNDQAPVANAGQDTSASEQTEILLDGYQSADREGQVVAYFWEQIEGPFVALQDQLDAHTGFVAPPVGSPVELQFRLTVTDEKGATDNDVVSITIVPELEFPADANEFLSYLNDASELFAGSQESADAYYAAIDPNNSKTNLGAWLAANGFAQGNDARAVYRNAADLGFGRVMAMRTNNDGSMASYVENYPTLESAVAAVESGNRDELLATVAMEFSPASTGGPMITKFYTFGPDDERLTSIDLDGRGAKFMPGLCNVCHGGRPEPLANGLFPHNGDTNAQFLPWDLETFEFSDNPLYTRAAQEGEFKALNSGSLSTYPLAPLEGKWSGAAARELIEGWYGGAGLPSDTVDSEFVPNGWRAEINGGPIGNPAGSEALYLEVIAPNCRACHIQRGLFFSEHEQGELIDFASYAKFMDYRERLVETVYNEGTMPDARVTFENFWSEDDGVIAGERLAHYLGIDAVEQRPGRPIANAGPDRTAPVGVVTLNGLASDFATTFAWSFSTNGRPSGSNASISGANTATPTIVTDAPGAYRLQLIVSDGNLDSYPDEIKIVSSFGVRSVSFANDVVPVIGETCMSCHSVGSESSVAGIPVRFDEPALLYERLKRYVNFEDIVASALLTKPSGQQHGGDAIVGFDLSELESADSSDYQVIAQWIAEGALRN